MIYFVGPRDVSVDRHEVDIFRELDDRHDVVMVEFTELIHCHRHRLDAKCRQSVLNHRHGERLLSFGVQPIDNGAGREKKFSEVREIRRSVIGAHEWVEALHSGSEIPNYDTYYFATITSELGILVTLSVNRNFSRQYVDRFKEMIKTLHVYQR